MAARRAVRVLLVVLLMSTTTGTAAPVAAQESGPTVSVAPSADLQDGQEVAVSGTGFRSGSTIFVGQCPQGWEGVSACEPRTQLRPDAQGSFTVTVPAYRFLRGGTVDCAVQACEIGATEIGGASATVPVDFADVASEEEIVLSPSEDLVDGQVVAVRGTGFTPGVPIDIAQCPPRSTTLADCPSNGTPDPSTTADADGAFETSVTVLRTGSDGDGQPYDCAVADCLVGIRSRRGTQFLPLRFADVPLPPALVVAPSAELLDGQVVELSGTGFPPGQTLRLATCRPGATDPSVGCAPSSLVPADTDDTGALAVGLPVERYVAGVDCADAPCVITAFDPSDRPVRSSEILGFSEVRTLQVTSSGHVDGGTAFVEGTGFTPGEQVVLVQCVGADGSTQPTACGSNWRESWYVEDDGTFDERMQVDRIIPLIDGRVVDCATVACTIVAQEGATSVSSDPLDIAVPDLGVTVVAEGTLRAGSNEAVARVEVTCDVATPVSLIGGVSQPGIESRWQLNEYQYCQPDAPLLVFVPTYDFVVDAADFALGTATVTVSISPLRSLVYNPPSARVEVTGTVELYDLDQVQAMVTAAVTDPASAEIREQVERAIVARVAQDPVFRDEWEAAVSGAG